MIPGLLAQDVAQSLCEFIVTGFETDTWPFSGKFEKLVNSYNDGEAFIKGPYVSINLPFSKSKDSSTGFFKDFSTEHSPFTHQQQAWVNLSSHLKSKSTLVATSTGSGKTECFLYPLLDHCLRNPKPGIKAIVIYPMNALAGDQAKRFADVIHNTPELKGKVRVGLFVGGASDEQLMGEKHVITSKNTLRKSPPDILLTNYKMLDFLLMRPKDQRLWKHNDEDTLKYLIVDELHTFDGAQGSDLAMLIRRLKARLKVKTESLICAGTSATLGSDTQMDDLSDYASSIFDTAFDRDSIIGESREANEDFLEMIEYFLLDPSFSPEQLKIKSYSSLNDYLIAQARLFLGDDWVLVAEDMGSRKQLGEQLKRHLLFHNILSLSRNGPIAMSALIPALQKQIPVKLKNHAIDVLVSLLALISHARGERYSGEPFVTIRTQLWARELRRIVSRVGDDSDFNPVHLQFSDDLKSKAENDKNGDIYLPIVQCNECHTTAWLTCVEPGESNIEQDLRTIYTRFFSSHKGIRVLLPLQNRDHQPPIKGLVKNLCSSCGHLQSDSDVCSACDEKTLVTIFEPDLNKSVKRGGIPVIESQRMCPVCQAKSSLILFGSRASSLSSVAIHQLFSNQINDDKKLIAFSDSVQDAAHRAGFFAARTWQNNIRMALAKTVTRYEETHSQPIALEGLYQYFSQYWLNDAGASERLTKLDFITQFIAPNMQSHEDYMGLKEEGRLDLPDKLIGQINKRLIWEMLNEFGIRSLIGRSLDRTGVATIYWDPKLITTAAEYLVGTASEQLGYELDSAKAKHLLWGIALRMRRQGAVYHKFMKGYVEQGGNWYFLSRNFLSFMPDIGNYSILPRFPGETSEKGLDRLTAKKQSTWYSRWLQKFNNGDQLVADHFKGSSFEEDVLKLAMNALVKAELLIKIVTKKENLAWAIDPNKLFITTKLSAVQLNRKQNDLDSEVATYGSWFIPSGWLEALEGLPSLDHVSPDTQQEIIYLENTHPKISMYREFYLNGEIKRVIGHEHTGLLERGYREALEQRFMAKSKDRQPWFENLLSATPTLEMGIDIGDLSSVLLCSVPPSQANYLQRAGRGGRKDGNSFVLTLANGHPHDLYFYADPLKMLAGDVQAPAIFLNASMVLRRQLLAYCFDHWGISRDGEHIIPGSMQSVLDAVEKTNLKRFPYTLLDFVGKNRDELWEGFNQLLGGDVLDETKMRLKSYLLGSSADEDAMHVFVLDRIKLMADERKNLIRHQKELESEIKGLKKKPQDEARDELEKELSTELEGIKRIKTDLNRKDTLNFLTDDGLLPNYAFPEEGTTLRSVILRRLSKAKQLGDGKITNYDSKTFEYSRPAHAALSELVPESVFYASNRKVKIERVEMARGENLEYWRLCPSCSFSERIQGADKDASCPNCHDPMWADSSQLMPMVKLRQVYANTREEDAFIGDDSDTREPTFYNKQMLIDFEPEDILHAYAMKTDTRPFGFEFIKKVQFKEINFGKQGGSDQMLNVAGVELARPGFRLCKECGTVQYKKNEPKHLFKCSYRLDNEKLSAVKNKNGDNASPGIIDCLYLYRQYESEAVRILMPKLSVVDKEDQMQSFVAALQLGLKTKFGGKVDHLNITISDEPIAGYSGRASYLVLYDTVPGGTGYLHTLLADPKDLMGTLALSQKIMAECECQNDADLDGCYNCLYAYKNSYGMESTSRTVALSMLADILDDDIELEAVENLGKVNKNTWADSELESRFPEALLALSKHEAIDGQRIRITKDIIKGKIGFKLEIGVLIYSVELHARLNKEHGVAHPCEPDFMISLDKNSDEPLKIAVFLDGYRYHKDIVHEDLMKRQGISLNGQMLTWSLTWYDVNHVFAGNEAKIPNALRDNIDNAPVSLIDKVANKKGLNDHNKIAELSPLLLLVKVLSKPDLSYWREFSMLRILSWIDQTKMQTADEKENFDSHLNSWPSQYTDTFSSPELIFYSSTKIVSGPVETEVFIAGEQAAITELDPESLILSVVFNPKDTDSEVTKLAWQKLLQILNVGQFLPKFFIGTNKGVQDGNYSQLEWGSKVELLEDSAWDKISHLVDEGVLDIIQKLVDKNIPIPEVGYELVDLKGAGIGEAELAWEESKVVLMLDHQLEEGKKEFEKSGWVVFTLENDINVMIEKLRDS